MLALSRYLKMPVKGLDCIAFKEGFVMTLSEYFEKADGLGILATADSEGAVDDQPGLLPYGRPGSSMAGSNCRAPSDPGALGSTCAA